MNTNIFGIFFLTRIRIRIYSGSTSGPNTNTNIFVSIKWTEYEYSNIFGSNIRILFDEYSNIPWNAAIGIIFVLPKCQGCNHAINLFTFKNQNIDSYKEKVCSLNQ